MYDFNVWKQLCNSFYNKFSFTIDELEIKYSVFTLPVNNYLVLYKLLLNFEVIGIGNNCIF